MVEAPDVNGISRLYAFTSWNGGPGMYVWIGIPVSVLYAESNRILVLSLIGLGIVAGLAIAAAWVFGDLLILRRVRALIHGTERLKAGDLASRVQVVGRGELSILASSFNEMGDRLQTAHNQLAAQVKELTRHERELSLLREIDLKILAEAPIADILSHGVEAFTELAEAKACVLVRLDQESGDGKSIAVYAPSSEGAQWAVVPMRLVMGEGAFGGAIATRAAVLIPDISIDPQMVRYRDHLLALGIHALFAVPLCIEQTVVAVVGLGYPTARSFSDAEVRTMEGFANQLTIAWEQARLREEAKARWRLEEAARLKALFIANMSHELRTPLNSVLGFSELLKDAAFGTLNDKQRRYVGHIYESGKHLLALIEDILDLSKVEAGKIELRCEPLQIADVLESAVELIRGQVVKNGIALELSVEEKLPLIVADPVRLRQIVFNLLSNAVKFTPEGGRITMTGKSVRNGDNTEWVEIAVIDSGVGMKPDDLPKLFQPFVRLDTALNDQTKGTGLGLALTKHLVELHGGQITAASEGMGQGSTFTIRLPFAPQSGVPTL
jgi:signal transduction histidine kinase/HAMP domain-containing protein